MWARTEIDRAEMILRAMESRVHHDVGTIDSDTPTIVRVESKGPSARGGHDDRSGYLDDIIISATPRERLIVSKTAVCTRIEKIADRRHDDGLACYIASGEGCIR